MKFLLTILGGFFAAWALMQNWRIKKIEQKRQAVLEAVKIAQVFAAEMVDSLTTLVRLLNMVKMNELIENKLEDHKTYRFDKEEADCLLGVDWVSKYEDIESEFSTYAKVLSEKYDEYKDIEDAFDNTRNRIEWMAMVINSGAADQTVIYQSLHQLLLPFIRLAYCSIAYSNGGKEHKEDGPFTLADKYYCSTILLYNEWNKRRIVDIYIENGERAAYERKKKGKKRKHKSPVAGHTHI